MEQSDPILKEQDRVKLDGIVQQMIANNESEEAISLVVSDFKSKYGAEKKSPDQTGSDGSGIGSDASRPDGSPKGRGFLGPIQGADGREITELSIGVEMDGEEVLIPTVVPTLNQEEIEWIKAGGDPARRDDPMAERIVDKAVKHAQERREQGLPVFAETFSLPDGPNFGQSAFPLTRESAQEQADQDLIQQRGERSKERAYIQRIEQTPIEEINDRLAESEENLTRLSSEYVPIANELGELQEATQRFIEARQRGAEISPEDIQEAQVAAQRMEKLYNQALDIENDLCHWKEMNEQALVDRHQKRKMQGTVLGGMDYQARSAIVDMSADLARKTWSAKNFPWFEAWKKGLFYEQGNLTLNEEDLKEYNEAMVEVEKKIDDYKEFRRKQWEESTGTTQEYIGDKMDGFGLVPGVLTLAYSGPMMMTGLPGMMMGYSESAMEAIKNAPGAENMTYTEKSLYSTLQGVVNGTLEKFGLQAMLGVGAGGRFAQGFTNRVIKVLHSEGQPITYNSVQRMAIRMAQGGISEGLITGSQEAVNISMEEITNILKDEQVFNPNEWETVRERIGHAAGMGLNAGLIFSAGPALVNARSRFEVERDGTRSPLKISPTPEEYQIAESILTEQGFEDFQQYVNDKMVSGDLSAEAGAQMLQDGQTFVDIASRIDPSNSPEVKARAFEIIKEKITLENEISQYGDTVNPEKIERHEQVNQELAELFKRPEAEPVVEASQETEEVETETNWPELVDESTSERELDALINQIDGAEAMTPELMDSISKKRESLQERSEPISGQETEGVSEQQKQETSESTEEETQPSTPEQIDALTEEQVSEMFEQWRESFDQIEEPLERVSEFDIDAPAEMDITDLEKAFELSTSFEQVESTPQQQALSELLNKVIRGDELTQSEQAFYELNREAIDDAANRAQEQFGETTETAEPDMTGTVQNAAETTVAAGINEASYIREAGQAEFENEFKKLIFSEEGLTLDAAREAAQESTEAEVTVADIASAVESLYEKWRRGEPITEAQKKQARKRAEKLARNPFQEAKEEVISSAKESLADIIRSGKIDPREVTMVSIPGFVQAYNATLEAAASAIEAVETLAEKYKVFMEYFMETDFWKSLNAYQKSMVDRHIMRKTKVLRYAQPMTPAVQVSEPASMRKHRMEVISLTEQLQNRNENGVVVDSDGNTHTLVRGKRTPVEDVIRQKLDKAKRDYLKAALEFGPKQAVEGVKEFEAKVRQEEAAKRKKAVKETRSKMQDRIDDLRETFKHGFREYTEAKEQKNKEKMAALRESLNEKIAELKEAIKEKAQEQKDVRADVQKYLDAVRDLNNEFLTENDHERIRSQIANMKKGDLGAAMDVLSQIDNNVKVKSAVKDVMNALDTKTKEVVNSQVKGKNVDFQGRAYLELLQDLLKNYLSKATGLTGISNAEITRMTEAITYYEEQGRLLGADLGNLSGKQLERASNTVKSLKEKRDTAVRQLEKALDKREDFLSMLNAANERASKKSLSADRIESAQGQYELVAIEDVRLLLEATPDNMGDVVKMIEKTIADSKSELATQIAKEAARLESLNNMVVSQTEVAGANLTKQEKINQARFRFADRVGRMAKRLATAPVSELKKMFFDPTNATFEQMLKNIDVGSNAEEGVLWRTFWRDGVRSAQGQYFRRIEAARKTIQSKYKEVFGRNAFLEFFGAYDGMTKVKENTGIELTIDGEKVPLHTSQDAVMTVYAWSKNPEVWNRLKDQGWTQESIEQAKKFIGKKNVEFVDWTVNEFLPEISREYNEKHVEIFRAAFGKVENYFPLVVDAAAISAEVNIGETKISLPFMTPKHTKERVAHKHPIDTTTGFFSTLQGYVNEMEKFYAYARVMKDASSVLSNKNFRNNLEAMSEGNFNLFQDATLRAMGFESQGDWSLKESMKTTNKWEARYSLSLLGFKYYSHLKQLLSFPAIYAQSEQFVLGGHYIPGVGSLHLTAELLVQANPVMMVRNHLFFMKNSDSYAERVSKGNFGEEAINIAKTGKTSKGRVLTSKRLTEPVPWAMSTGLSGAKVMDALIISTAGKALYNQVYRYTLLTTGNKVKAKKAAMDKFENFLETQQFDHPGALGAAQSKKNLFSVMARFKNAEFIYLRRSYGSLLNISQRFQREKAKVGSAKAMARLLTDRQTARDLKTYFIFAHVMPALWEWGTIGYPWLFSEGDDDDLKNILTKSAMGPISYPFIIGEGVKQLMYWHSTGKDGKKRRSVDVLQLPAAAEQFNKSMNELLKAYDESQHVDDGATKIMVEAIVEALAKGGSVDLGSIDQIHDGIVDLIERKELTRENVLKILNAPKSVQERSSPNSKTDQESRGTNLSY